MELGRQGSAANPHALNLSDYIHKYGYIPICGQKKGQKVIFPQLAKSLFEVWLGNPILKAHFSFFVPALIEMAEMTQF